MFYISALAGAPVAVLIFFTIKENVPVTKPVVDDDDDDEDESPLTVSDIKEDTYELYAVKPSSTTSLPVKARLHTRRKSANNLLAQVRIPLIATRIPLIATRKAC